MPRAYRPRSKRKDERKRHPKAPGTHVPEDFQIYDLPKGASKRSARFYNKGGPRPRDKFRPD